MKTSRHDATTIGVEYCRYYLILVPSERLEFNTCIGSVFAAGLQNLKKFAATFWGIPAGRAAQAFTVT
jgi:hypothetical protein